MHTHILVLTGLFCRFLVCECTSCGNRRGNQSLRPISSYYFALIPTTNDIPLNTHTYLHTEPPTSQPPPHGGHQRHTTTLFVTFYSEICLFFEGFSEATKGVVLLFPFHLVVITHLTQFNMFDYTYACNYVPSSQI